MRTLKRQLRLLGGAVALAGALLVLVNGAFSAGGTHPWQWQAEATPETSRDLIATASPSGQIILAASVDPSGIATLVVSANGRQVQRATAASLPDDAPVAVFIVGVGASEETIVGVARSDVAHLLLRYDDVVARELLLNSVGAFAVSDVAPRRTIQLEALAADGSTIARIDLPTTTANCGALGPCNSETTQQGSRRAGLSGVPRAFARPRRATDALPRAIRVPNPARLGASEKIIATRRIAAYTDGRGRRALLYLAKTAHQICYFTFWGAGAGGGCGPSTSFFAGGHLVVGSSHLLSGVADDDVASLVVVGRRGVRHPVEVTADGGFIYDCKAYNGCTCVVDHVDALDFSGKTIETHQVLGRCGRATQSLQRSSQTPTAPSRTHGTIAWLFRHELRGQSLAQAGIRITRTVGSHWQPVRFARVLTPDPASRARIVLSLIGKRGLNVCLTLFPAGAKATNDAGGGGCAVGLTLTPLSTMTAYGPSGGYIAGAADDKVARIALHFLDGSTRRVPLHDNVFFIRVPTGASPRTIVSFDDAGRMIARETLRSGAPPLRHSPRLAAPSAQQVQSARSSNRYTISNRGRLVSGHGNKLFQGHPYQLFLLGTIGGRAYYRVQLTPHYTCWGSGPRDNIGLVGGLGCPAVVGAYPLQLDDNVVELKRGARTPHSLRFAGIVADQAASVALRDGTGKTLTTVPVENNLFAFSPPFPNGSLRAVPLDAQGKLLPPHPEWGQHQTPPPNLFGPRAAKISPSSLGTVVQRGEAKGVTVSADQNGVVVFDTRSINASTRRALAGRIAWFACFQINGQNVRQNRSAGITTPLAPIVAFKLTFKPHYDGCEAGGSYGHRWHDQYGPHSTLEVPLTAQGTRYFEDRATARDLAAFVRSAKTQAIRRNTGAELKTAIRRAYGDEISFLTSSSASAAPGRVGVWSRGSRTIFSERSHLGDRFYVQFDDGKLTHQNVRGLAFVF